MWDNYTEKQGQLLYDINCFYQLSYSMGSLMEGNPLTELSDLFMLSLKLKNNNPTIDWTKVQDDLIYSLLNYGFTAEWIKILIHSYNNARHDNYTLDQYRSKFLFLISNISNTIYSMMGIASKSMPVNQIIDSTIYSIYHQDIFTGKMGVEIKYVIALTEELELTDTFFGEYCKVLWANK